MKRKTNLILVLFFLFPLFIDAQSDFLEGEIQYLSNPPLIDGILDSSLQFLEKRDFPVIQKDDASNPDLAVSYRLAYGTDFLYVYIEAEAEKLSYRDRAYQNGDGFHMVLAKPKPNNQASDEFYVLACSAVKKKSMEWTRNIFWYYNVDHIFKRTSEDTKLMFTEQDGIISFELLLPWKDVHPYHPWLSEGIGFNLCFVKAINQLNKTSYKVLNAQLDSENSKREYLKLKFQKPTHTGEPQTFLLLNRNNISHSEILTGTAVTIASGDNREELIVKILSGENTLLDYRKVAYNCQKGITIKHFEINKNPLAAGGYKMEWYSRINESSGESYLTSLPEFDQQHIINNIELIKDKISPSSYFTLKHQLLEIGKELTEIKSYETCGKQRLAISALRSNIEKSKDTDFIAMQRAFVRKAYQSELDSTLQPYMVYLPENYSPDKKYPLLVYLHGSASDESNIKGAKYLIPEGFIALAPRGRGPSNCYSWDHAQADIAESIDAVLASYSIDENHIFLSGFSMGGYGTYRTFYETPEKFKGIAVFSGHPNIANQWSGGGEKYPDFTREKYLKKFKGVPVFIFHGKEDRNCPFETTLNIIETLKKNGAKVEFVTEEDKGHEPPNKESVQLYDDWINAIMNNTHHTQK